MKQKIASFFKPRVWTVFLAFFLVGWQYLYAFRGIDFDLLSQVRTYFGFGLSAVNWNNFLVRTLSLGLIWLLLAGLIFLLLWLAEAYIVASHNRKIAKNYANQPKEEYQHLLKSSEISLKAHLGSYLWLSAFFVLIIAGLFLLTGLVETLRSTLVIDYISAAQDAGTMIDYYDVNLIVISFLATLPLWYLFACLDYWCLSMSRREKTEAKIEDEHYAVPVIIPTEAGGDDENVEADDQNDSNLPPAPVI